MSATTIRAAVIRDYLPGFDHVQVAERAQTPPGDQDVVVQIHAAPIHPADLAFIQGYYGIRKPLPASPGFEAAGVVTAVGAGVSMDWVGRRVCCLAGEKDGTWAQSMTTPAVNAFPVPDAFPDDLAAMMLINPLSAWALVDLALASGTQALLQTAAASAVGKMILKRCAQVGIETINVVRREAQIAELQAAGARYILNSSEPTFDKHLRELTRSLETRIAVDAVGGDLTGKVLRAIRDGGEVIVYGGLDGAPAAIGVDQLIFRRKSIRGFWLTHWLRDVGEAKRLAAWNDIQASAGDYEARVADRFPLDAVHDAIAAYTADMTRGKVLLIP